MVCDFSEVAAGYETPSETCAFEIYVPQLVAASKKDRVYKQLPKFPGIARDLAVTTESKVTVADIIKTAKSAGGKYLRDVKMFDVYTGDKLGEGLKSVAISLSFRADDKTLSDDDIKNDIDNIIGKLESKLGAKLRQ